MAKKRTNTKTITLVKDGLSLRKACVVVVNLLEAYIIEPNKDYEFVRMDTETGKPVLDDNQQPIKYKKKGGALSNEEIDIVLDVWSEFANMNALRKDGPYVSIARTANNTAMTGVDVTTVPKAEFDEVVGDVKDNE